MVYGFVKISQAIGWEGWVFCTSGEGWEDRLRNDL